MNVIIIIGLIFSPIGAVMAFLITYEEYTHHYADQRKIFRQAVKTAVFTFFVLLAVTIIAGLFLRRIV